MFRAERELVTKYGRNWRSGVINDECVNALKVFDNVHRVFRILPNAKVSDGSQPPMTLNSSLSESAGSRSLHRLVGPCHHPAKTSRDVNSCTASCGCRTQ